MQKLKIKKSKFDERCSLKIKKRRAGTKHDLVINDEISLFGVEFVSVGEIDKNNFVKVTVKLEAFDPTEWHK